MKIYFEIPFCYRFFYFSNFINSLKSAEPDTSIEEEKKELLTSLMSENTKKRMTDEEKYSNWNH